MPTMTKSFEPTFIAHQSFYGQTVLRKVTLTGEPEARMAQLRTWLREKDGGSGMVVFYTNGILCQKPVLGVATLNKVKMPQAYFSRKLLTMFDRTTAPSSRQSLVQSHSFLAPTMMLSQPPSTRLSSSLTIQPSTPNSTSPQLPRYSGAEKSSIFCSSTK
jgi:hypothetical protein